MKIFEETSSNKNNEFIYRNNLKWAMYNTNISIEYLHKKQKILHEKIIPASRILIKNENFQYKS